MLYCCKPSSSSSLALHAHRERPGDALLSRGSKDKERDPEARRSAFRSGMAAVPDHIHSTAVLQFFFFFLSVGVLLARSLFCIRVSCMVCAFGDGCAECLMWRYAKVSQRGRARGSSQRAGFQLVGFFFFFSPDVTLCLR